MKRLELWENVVTEKVFRKKAVRSKLLSNKLLITLLSCGLMLAGCSKENEVEAPEPQAGAGDWSLHGLDHGEQRFSPLDQINDNNVGQLELAWYVDLPDAKGQEATPLVIDGVMYTSAAWNIVFALDAATGKELWRFDPKVDRSRLVQGCCGAVSRGIAFWEGKVIVATFDGRLIGLDAQSGEQLWSTLTIDLTKPYTITGAPRVVDGKVYIGNGGAEFGVRGYISAYDANTGDMLWRFYTVPGEPSKPFEHAALEKAADTWYGEWWKYGGGGTVWDSMAYDADLNLLYFGVGNGSPWNPNVRSDGKGDNLYLSSIVAVNADTGEYVWHYQSTPGEGWDYTATQHMILTDLEIEGQQRKVIMQAPKNGFFYVLDRQTGELISAEPFVTVSWASHIDLETGRPVFNEEAKYWKTGKAALVSPNPMGAHSWHPMAYNPNAGLVYIPAQEMAYSYLGNDDMKVSKYAMNIGLTQEPFPDDPAIMEMVKKVTVGHLAAWDPVAQKEVWRVQFPAVWNGGVLSTAGNLVFQGNAGGKMVAYRATDGEKLWEFDAQTGVVAPPMSYSVNGEQYISVMAGWGGTFALNGGDLARVATDSINRSRVLTFKVGGKAKLPDINESPFQMVDLTAEELDASQVDKGHEIYLEYCVRCHGINAVGGGVNPDLRYSGFLLAEEAWDQVVSGGILSQRGMVSFSDELSKEDVAAVRSYVISRNQQAHASGDTQRMSR